MSDITLSRRAVACPGWRWLPGVRWRLDPAKCGPGGHDPGRKFGRVDELWRAVDDTGRVLISHDNILPDLTDPCTLGGLEALVRERWGDGAHASPDHGRNPNPDWWVWRKIIDGWTVVARGPTRAAALVAALEAP